MQELVKKEELSDLTFPERLIKLRKMNGYSQRELARKSGLHHGQYGRYERGDSKPYADTLTKLADALNVSADYLLEGEEEDAVIANFEDRDLLKLFQEIERFSSQEKEHVKFILNSVVKNKQHTEVTNA